jgi:hypothetical protein
MAIRVAAMLTIEAPSVEVVELSFTLPDGPVSATVRHKNTFRYGFESRFRMGRAKPFGGRAATRFPLELEFSGF